MQSAPQTQTIHLDAVCFFDVFVLGWISPGKSILTWAISSFRIAFSAEPGCEDRVMVGNGRERKVEGREETVFASKGWA
jgi:hypothetical protein